MAIYEGMGYCPMEDFSRYMGENKEGVSELWNEAQNILGNRLEYMYYPGEENYFMDEGSIVDAIVRASDTLGVEIALSLKWFIPNSEDKETARPIICHDVLSPIQLGMPRKLKAGNKHNKWAFATDAKMKKHCLMEDERYIVYMKDNGVQVSIYLYKK